MVAENRFRKPTVRDRGSAKAADMKRGAEAPRSQSLEAQISL
jgi:hypothetical protein